MALPGVKGLTRGEGVQKLKDKIRSRGRKSFVNDPFINELFNEDLDCLKTWLATNKLSLNVAKTHNLIFDSGHKLKSIQQSTAVKPSLVIDKETIYIIKGH